MAIDEDALDDELAFEEEGDDQDMLATERKRRSRQADLLKRTAGMPVKPTIEELHKMNEVFLVALKNVLSN